MGQGLGPILLLMGLALILMGGLFLLMPHVPFLGKLPGDLSFRVGNLQVFAPIVTCILLSVVLTLVLNFFTRR